jgi:hypothetical protein
MADSLLMLFLCSCVEHAVHLCASHIVQEIAPTSLKAMIQRIKAGLAEGVSAEVLNDQLDTLLTHDTEEDNDESEDEGDLVDADDVSDALGIALELIKQVCQWTGLPFK